LSASPTASKSALDVFSDFFAEISLGAPIRRKFSPSSSMAAISPAAGSENARETWKIFHCRATNHFVSEIAATADHFIPIARESHKLSRRTFESSTIISVRGSVSDASPLQC
jgi:hypothetical protein